MIEGQTLGILRIGFCAFQITVAGTLNFSFHSVDRRDDFTACMLRVSGFYSEVSFEESLLQSSNLAMYNGSPQNTPTTSQRNWQALLLFQGQCRDAYIDFPLKPCNEITPCRLYIPREHIEVSEITEYR